MTDTTKLKLKISEKGLKISFVAEQIGITRASLSAKINNKSIFRANEIVTITKVLGLTRAERDAIFFANDSE